MPVGRPKSLVLASGSPRRRMLLEQAGLRFEVLPADLDETLRPGEAPRAYVERLAREKAAAIAPKRPGAVILAADTAVVLEGEVLGKPRDVPDAERMLSKLSGRAHSVITGVALAGAAAHCAVVESAVRFRALTPAQIAWYVATGEPMDKAGAYAVQGTGGAWVESIEGSPTNVIGLPLPEVLALLGGIGFRMPWEGT